MCRPSPRSVVCAIRPDIPPGLFAWCEADCSLSRPVPVRTGVPLPLVSSLYVMWIVPVLAVESPRPVSLPRRYLPLSLRAFAGVVPVAYAVYSRCPIPGLSGPGPFPYVSGLGRLSLLAWTIPRDRLAASPLSLPLPPLSIRRSVRSPRLFAPRVSLSLSRSSRIGISFG